MGKLRNFLEEKNLYSPEIELLPINYSGLDSESLNIFCKNCKSNQTFNLISAILNGVEKIKGIGRSITSSDIMVNEKESGFLHLCYVCAMCKKEQRIFSLNIQDRKVKKIGQFPPIDISLPKEIESLEDSFIEELYKKGRTCETQGYGIGAFAYYRRIIELKIDEVLEKIKEFFPKEKIKEYEEILEKVKKEKNAEKKIEIVKEVITDEIIQNNPLKTLYDILSKGIHQLSDEECLECAISTRELLIGLIKEIENKKGNEERLVNAQKTLEKIDKKQKEVFK